MGVLGDLFPLRRFFLELRARDRPATDRTRPWFSARARFLLRLPALIGAFGLVRRARPSRLPSFSLAQGTTDHVPCALPDPFSLDRLTFPEASVDVCEVLSSSPNGSAPFLDGIRFEALRALCSRSHLRGIAEAIANAEVLAGVALSSATLVPLDKLTPAERNALELSAGDMKGSVRPSGIGSVLVRFAMRVLLRAHGEPIAQWLAARGQFGFGVKGGVELVQFLVRSLLDSDPSLVLVQLDAENAFNSFYRSEMFRTQLEDPV
eukprot:jgi/Tetstr1/434009/TSEL_002443.t1